MRTADGLAWHHDPGDAMRTRYVAASIALGLAVLMLALSGCGDDESRDNLAPAGSQAQCPARCTLEDAPCSSGFECWASTSAKEFLCCDERPLTSFVRVLPVGQNAQCTTACALVDSTCPPEPGLECWADPITQEFRCCFGRI